MLEDIISCNEVGFRVDLHNCSCSRTFCHCQQSLCCNSGGFLARSREALFPQLNKRRLCTIIPLSQSTFYCEQAGLLNCSIVLHTRRAMQFPSTTTPYPTQEKHRRETRGARNKTQALPKITAAERIQYQNPIRIAPVQPSRP